MLSGFCGCFGLLIQEVYRVLNFYIPITDMGLYLRRTRIVATGMISLLYPV